MFPSDWTLRFAMICSTDRIRLFILSGGGAGLIRFAPGTWGTVVGTLLFLAATTLSEPWQTVTLAAMLLAACGFTVGLGSWAEAYFKGKDPQCCVLDEIAGILLVLTLLRGSGHVLVEILWAFPLFRLLDIAKLAPARQAERLPQGWGILVDDLISGMYVAAILWGIRWLLPAWFAVS